MLPQQPQKRLSRPHLPLLARQKVWQRARACVHREGRGRRGAGGVEGGRGSSGSGGGGGGSNFARGRLDLARPRLRHSRRVLDGACGRPQCDGQSQAVAAGAHCWVERGSVRVCTKGRAGVAERGKARSGRRRAAGAGAGARPGHAAAHWRAVWGGRAMNPAWRRQCCAFCWVVPTVRRA